jgi:cation diffusion facilitator CzcD-associated flavoprotein CzcO/amino acid transporter
MDDSVRLAAKQFNTGNATRLLSTPRIVFLVVAAAAPLAAMVANLPISLSRGIGAATPAAFLFAGVTLLCFSVGYAAVSRRIVSSGAFYTYVAKGLGKPAGVGAAFTAMLAYVGYTVGLAAFLGYFLALMLNQAGLHTSWLPYALGGVGIVALLGYHSIDLSAKILGALMTAEIAVLSVYDISVIAAKGLAAFPLNSFAPDRVFSPGLGIGLMFAFTSFIGFESAALYGEEATNPRRSIPAATYASVVLIAVFYLLTAWVTVGAIAPANVHDEATRIGGTLLLELFRQYDGEAMEVLLSVLVCTSLLAAYLALHNAATRYLFALSREKLLPRVLGRFHPRRYAPSNASLCVSAISAVFVGGFGAFGLDPYQTLIPACIGLGTLGIVLLQALAGVAICAYLWPRRAETGMLTLAAAGAGAAGLVTATWLVGTNFGLLTTSDTLWIGELPWIYVPVVGAGVAFSFWIKAYRPKAYFALATAELRADSERRWIARDTPVSYAGRYCIVGAGPCGLLAARAFKLAGIPYDQFEQHNDVGGIWDIENPGTSMYESAHFISSKFVSGFYGLPMPDDFPDYPSHRQILTYIRDFADRFDLRRGIAFGIGVAHAEPIGPDAVDGWRVELSNGEVRTYLGLVCANGVTWHPNMPDYAGLDMFQGEARHSVTYRSAEAFHGKRVLIVGAGNSGVDIACDAARNADAAFISLRRGYHFVPKHMFGIPTDIFLSGGVQPPKGVVIPDDPSDMLAALVGDLTRYGLPAPDHKVLQSHPIMNSQILHCLAHGDLKAKPDIRHFTPDGVVFADGSAEKIDLVLFATGYDLRMPFLNEKHFSWKQGRPQLYLNIFHRRLRGLAVIGYVEFASAGYKRFDEMAQMAAMDAYIEQSGAGRDEWRRMKDGDQPNLRGTTEYIDSPRHANYVDVGVFQRVLSEIREKFAWPDPGETLYDTIPAAAPRPVPPANSGSPRTGLAGRREQESASF